MSLQGIAWRATLRMTYSKSTGSLCNLLRSCIFWCHHRAPLDAQRHKLPVQTQMSGYKHHIHVWDHQNPKSKGENICILPLWCFEGKIFGIAVIMVQHYDHTILNTKLCLGQKKKKHQMMAIFSRVIFDYFFCAFICIYVDFCGHNCVLKTEWMKIHRSTQKCTKKQKNKKQKKVLFGGGVVYFCGFCVLLCIIENFYEFLFFLFFIFFKKFL